MEESIDICLEEKEDTGKSELSFGIASKDNLAIKNVDMKHTDLYFFQNKGDKSFSWIIRNYPSFPLLKRIGSLNWERGFLSK